jgi:Arc/MetJ-type ribon-helix-helix transcriptional regulator
MIRRIAIVFDGFSLGTLIRVQARGEFPSMAAAVREGIERDLTLLEQAESGFTELLVRNPVRHQEKQIVVPLMRRAARRRMQNLRH